jgi:23S rRNA (cytidine2498-2'-O)-methyltransferase
MPAPSSFIFLTCQIGAEKAVKGEMARRWPDFRFSYSRPGFLTFKLPENIAYAEDLDLGSVFARAYSFSLGKVQGAEPDEMAKKVWEVFGDRTARRIHVWPRDAAEPGEHGYEPILAPETFEIHRQILAACPQPAMLAPDAADMCRPSRRTDRGEPILDCVLVAPGEWWIGHHRVGSITSSWPGGMLDLKLPVKKGDRGILPERPEGCSAQNAPVPFFEPVSRAWLKMEEALRWSRLPIPRDARVAEIGSAPGGSSQALLARGFYVTGIDPAEMHPAVLAHSRFTHLRRRSTQVRRREFRKIRWLTVDMNVAPGYTLETVEEIVTHPEVHIRGMILTLKFPEWSLAEEVPQYLARIKSWGYNLVRARQLQHNRREICVAALMKPFHRKTMHDS